MQTPRASTDSTASRRLLPAALKDTMRSDDQRCVRVMGGPSLHTDIKVTLTPIDDPTDRRELTLTAGIPVFIGRASKSSHKALQRQPDNALFDCPVISRCHAKLQYRPWEDRVTIVDQNSMHGTFLNRVAITASQSLTLKPGDILRFGEEVTRGNELHKPLSVKFDYVPTTMPESLITPNTPVRSSGFHVSVPSEVDSSDFDASCFSNDEEDSPMPSTTNSKHQESDEISPKPDDERSVVEVTANDPIDASGIDHHTEDLPNVLKTSANDHESKHSDDNTGKQQGMSGKMQVASSSCDLVTPYTSEPDLLSNACDWSDAMSQECYDDSDEGPEILSSKRTEEKIEPSMGISWDRSSGPEASLSTTFRPRYDPVRGSPVPINTQHNSKTELYSAAVPKAIAKNATESPLARALHDDHIFGPLHIDFGDLHRQMIADDSVNAAALPFQSNLLPPPCFPFSNWASLPCDHDAYDVASTSINPPMETPFDRQEYVGSTRVAASRPTASRIAIDDIVDNTLIPALEASDSQNANGRKRKATVLEDEPSYREPASTVVENNDDRSNNPLRAISTAALANNEAPRRHKRSKTSNGPSFSSKARYFAAGGVAMHLVFHYNLINIALDLLGWPRFE